jgi:hypothetical protein
MSNVLKFPSGENCKEFLEDQIEELERQQTAGFKPKALYCFMMYEDEDNQFQISIGKVANKAYGEDLLWLLENGYVRAKDDLLYGDE